VATADPAAIASLPDGDVLRFRAIAFGLDIATDVDVPYLSAFDVSAPPGPRRATLRRVGRKAMRELAGDLCDSVPVFERRFASGKPMLLVRRSADAYRLWAPRHGEYIVSAAGDRISARIPDNGGWWWTRLLFAQVLPLAASLQGLECLHAGCVALGGRAYALAAPSGTGKSSTLLHLVARGALLVSDDVIATDVAGGSVTVHPGPRIVGADPAELAKIPPDRRPRAVVAAPDDPKTHVDLNAAQAPLPLAAMYFLHRDPAAATLVVRPTVDAGRLLGSRFLSYLDEPEQLARHLDTAASIAGRVEMFEVAIPKSSSAVDVAAALAAHMGSG
jgi:hypothetical protein